MILCSLLRHEGYIVIQPNFRGSSGYGIEFEEAGYGEWGGLMQDDLEDAVRFLAEQQVIDINNVCIIGSSYGGYAALMGSIKTPSLYKCAVSINGVTHLPKQIKYDLKTIKSERIRNYILESIGDPKTDLEKLNAHSPALHAEKIEAPILLIHSDKDEIVPYNQAKLMNKALKKHKKDFEFITLENTGNQAFYYREDTELIYKKIEAFLDQNLKKVTPTKPQ